MLNQQLKKQTGIKNVVNIIKKTEIPSKPKVKYKFNSELKTKVCKNWKFVSSESKKTIKYKESTKTKNI